MFHRARLWSFLSLPDQARAGSVPPPMSVPAPWPLQPRRALGAGGAGAPHGHEEGAGAWLRPVPPTVATGLTLGHNREKCLGEEEEVRGDTAPSDELCMTIGK